MVEDGQTEGLALGVGAEIRLKAERVDGGQEGLDGVEWRPGHGRVLGHVTSATENIQICFIFGVFFVQRFYQERFSFQSSLVFHLCPGVLNVRPPLSKKSFPVGRVGKRTASREVGIFFFS